MRKRQVCLSRGISTSMPSAEDRGRRPGSRACAGWRNHGSGTRHHRADLVGDRRRIEEAAKATGFSLSRYEIVEASSGHDAAAKSVALVHAGRADTLMKGHLHTDELLHEVLKKEGGLRRGRRLSNVFVMDVPGLEHLLLISDAAITSAPTLEEKVDITQNAIDLAIALGMARPRVGVLSAVETVTSDNAIDMEAARTKGITSLVAGKADILIVPNIEAGNMLAKELVFIAHADAAGIVLGARVPIILTSRADNEKARLASCAVAALYRASQVLGGHAVQEAA